jgi:hypothetical protein
MGEEERGSAEIHSLDGGCALVLTMRARVRELLAAARA